MFAKKRFHFHASQIEQWRNRFNACFPPSQQMTPKQWQEFMNGLNKSITNEIKKNEQQAKKANQRLKDAEEGKPSS